MKYGIIYKTTNTINDYIYIGQTKKDRKDYLGGGKWLNNAIKNMVKISLLELL